MKKMKKITIQVKGKNQKQKQKQYSNCIYCAPETQAMKLFNHIDVDEGSTFPITFKQILIILEIKLINSIMHQHT